MIKTIDDLTDHQKAIICQSVNGVGITTPISKEHRQAVNELSTEDLWSHFLALESDPQEVIDLYYSLFEPNHQISCDIMDLAWNLLLDSGKINRDYATVLLVTGRLSELKEYLHGIPKTQ
jgi:hypothetical protein